MSGPRPPDPSASAQPDAGTAASAGPVWSDAVGASADEHVPVTVVPAPEPTVSTAITRRPLSVDALLGAVTRSDVGGIALFVGVVRDHDEPAGMVGDVGTASAGRGPRGVSSLDYTAHPSAEHELHASAVRAGAAHEVVAVAVEHRIGHLEVGDLAVVVAVAAVHRGPALEACRALIDDLKQTVPIWKEQRFADGAVEWVGL